MAAPLKVSFEHFLEKFPEIALPVTLTAESHHHFDKYNDPLHLLMIEQFIVPYEEDDPDDMTEYMACFRLSDPGDFHAVGAAVARRGAGRIPHWPPIYRRALMLAEPRFARTFSVGAHSVGTITIKNGAFTGDGAGGGETLAI